MTDPQELRARVDLAFERHDVGDHAGALEIYDDLLDRAPPGDDPVTTESLFTARFDRAVILAEREALEEAAEGFAAAAAGLDPEQPDHRHEIAMGRLNQGVALAMLGRLDDAAEVYAEVVDRFVHAQDAPTREQVVRAWVNLAAVHLERGDAEAALATGDEILRHLDGAHDVWADEQREQVDAIRTAATEDVGRRVRN